MFYPSSFDKNTSIRTWEAGFKQRIFIILGIHSQMQSTVRAGPAKPPLISHPWVPAAAPVRTHTHAHMSSIHIPGKQYPLPTP